MYKYSNYKDHYARNLKLAAPVIMSQIGQVVVQMVDNAMVGRLGATSLAASSFAGSIFFMLFIFVMGISMGLTPIVGESYSQGKHAESASYLQNAIVIYLLIGVVIFAVQQMSVPLLYHLGQPHEVVELAVPYYKMLVWSVIPFMIFSTFKQFLEGIGNTKVTMFVVISTNLLNILGNYLLIYGNWGFPEMGVVGAGVSTLVSRCCMPVLVIAYFAYKDNFRRYMRIFVLSRFDWRYVKDLLKVGFPISMQMFMEVCAFALSSIMVGWIGTVEIAGNQIAMVISNFAFMAVVGVSSATTIRVSHEYGVGNLKRLNRAAMASLHIGIAWNCITALTFVLLRHKLPMIFTSDPEVIAVASQLLIFVGIFQFSDGLQCVAVGILRGVKDVKSIMAIAFLSYLVINLPIGYICAFKLNMGVIGLWIGFICGLTTASVLLISRYTATYVKLRRSRLSKVVGIDN